MTFKIGDRVRVVKHCNIGGDEIPLDAEIGSVHEVTKVYSPTDLFPIRYDLSGGGRNFYIDANIEPVTEGPIRTVTRREIVPGVYGQRGEITIGKAGTCTMVQVGINSPMSKNHLREAAHLFNQLAEVLEDV